MYYRRPLRARRVVNVALRLRARSIAATRARRRAARIGRLFRHYLALRRVGMHPRRSRRVLFG